MIFRHNDDKNIAGVHTTLNSHYNDIMTQEDNSHLDQNIDRLADDRIIWGLWMSIMLLSVICLPFIVRHSELARSFADMCLTALSLK